MVFLQRRKKQWQCAIISFGGVIVTKKAMAMCHHLFLWCFCSEEDDDNLLPLPFSFVVFKRRRQWQLDVIVFFLMLEKKKTMTMHCHFFLWCYWNKESNGKKLSSPSFLCLRRK
jgi:hypothetical protein